MQDDDIKNLFERVLKHFEGADEGARGTFSVLVKTTLKYRDWLVESNSSPLTVAETKAALNAFLTVLKEQKIPGALPKRVHDLVILWLKEIQKTVHN